MGSPCECRNYHLDNLCSNAAYFGHIECLRYAHENGSRLDENISLYTSGNIDCMQYVYEHGAPWHEHTTFYSLLYGNLECLRYAHQHGAQFNEHWNFIGHLAAFTIEQLQCIRYGILCGAPISKILCPVIIMKAKMKYAMNYVKIARKIRLVSKTLLAIQATPNIEDHNRYLLQRLIVRTL